MTTARQLEQPITNLYDADFLAWIEDQAQALRTRKANSLDWDNILEELESMGRSEKNALRSHLRVLLMHLIKWQWQPQKQSKSWATTIRNQRLDLKYRLKDSPSLKRLIPEMLPDAWDSAADEAAFETDLPISTFPESCSWDIDTQNWAICRSGFWDHQTEWCILSIFRKIISLRLWVTATPENIVEV